MTDETESTNGRSEDTDASSFVRWQGITLTQLGYAVNLILAFATASLGFSLSLITEENYTPGCWGKGFMALSLFMLLVSFSLGLWCVINRLLSFRHTKNAARTREKRDEMKKNSSCQVACIAKLEDQLKVERTRYKTLDKTTWVLFWFEIAAFGLGIIFLIASFVAVYHAKLF